MLRFLLPKPVRFGSYKMMVLVIFENLPVGPIGPREGSQKSPKPPNLRGGIPLPQGTKKRSIWARGFYVFYWCKKQKIELFF